MNEFVQILITDLINSNKCFLFSLQEVSFPGNGVNVVLYLVAFGWSMAS